MHSFYDFFLYNGIIPTLLIYPKKFLNESLLPYDSLLDNTTFLISTLSILTGLLQLWNEFLITISLPKSSLFLVLYQLKKKDKNFYVDFFALR